MPIPHTLQWEIDRIPRNRKVTHGQGVKGYAVDGLEPKGVVFPNTIEEMSSLLSAADRDGKAVVPWGGGTAMGLGNRALGCDLVISTSRLNRVLDYEPSDLTVVVEAGITLGTLQEELGENGQFLPLDPPLPDRATIGGILSANSSGPIRAHFGAIRDRLIGIKVVNPNGDVTKGGGKVVKNVSGYDMNKLYTGALGTLVHHRGGGFQAGPAVQRDLHSSGYVQDPSGGGSLGERSARSRRDSRGPSVDRWGRGGRLGRLLGGAADRRDEGRR